MATGNHDSEPPVETLIKEGVRDQLATLAEHSKAKTLGVDTEKAFDTSKTFSAADSNAIHIADESPAAPSLESLRLNEKPAHNIVEIEPTGDAKPDTPQASQPDITASKTEASASNDVAESEMPELEEAGKGADVGSALKKRKKKKPKSQRGQKGGTGFEEFHADAPLTPAQFDEEKGLYDVSRPFTERIETAIQRYVNKRNLDSDRKALFDKYLTYGGVDAGPRMFSGGLDADTIANSNAAEIATLTARHSVDPNKGNESEIYTTDFEGCLKGFLSSQFPAIFDLETEDQLKKLMGVIRNFLNYLLHHNVCTEYNDQIEASRVLCDQAQYELWNIRVAQPLLPGSFNTACSEIFGGELEGLQDAATQDWMLESDRVQMTMGITPEKARKVFKIGFAAYGTDEQVTKYIDEAKGQTFSVVNEKQIALEIIEIALGSSDADALPLYQSEEGTNLPILGRLRSKTWSNPGQETEDLTEQEEKELRDHPRPEQEYEFWVDDEILNKLSLGMKIEAKVKELSFGIFYFDQVYSVRCSFCTALANEAMLGWKKIEDQWLPPRGKGDDEIGEDGEVKELNNGTKAEKHRSPNQD